MIHQEQLQDLTESYLKSLISEISGALSSEFDSLAPFGELGIDSFYVLKIIRRLEADFGTLPKSLLFEHFTINDLASYFVRNHEQALAARFAEKLQGGNSFAHTNGWLKPVEAPEGAKLPAENRANLIAEEAAPIRILEREAYTHPQLRELVQTIFKRYKLESSVSRGTRTIAPNLFIGGARSGYFNYGRSKNIVLAYGYTGPREYLPVLLKELCGYCAANNFQLNILADREIPPVGDIVFSATPFGVAQRIMNLKQFTLEGGAMRRLRYQVSKFQKCGVCRTQEYQCGSNPDIDRGIVAIIDKWCEPRTKVHPLVHDVREEILAGKLGAEHRLFLTYLDDVLQNVILITALCSEENGYLTDLEFYSPDMPLGGLEFAIVQIINILAGEGCNVLSLGATLGCKLNSSPDADPEVDKILDDLRKQNIFNDEGNLQFKNKFRPESKTIFLGRPVGSGSPDNVIDIIMMIADPSKNQTSEEEKHAAKTFPQISAPAKPVRRESSAQFSSVSPGRELIEGNERSCILADFGFNPLNIPQEHVEFDLKTDSWAQLQMPSIEAQMRNLHAQLQQPANVDESLRVVFPFAYCVLTASGQAAENVFFRAWPKKGIALQNLLFPSTIFHQIDKGFSSKELPHPAVFDLNSPNLYKGNMDWEALQAQVAQDPNAIALVCIEVSSNAAGGCPVSMQHLRDVKALLAQYSIPLVVDGTRVVENAQFLIEQDRECAGKSVWTVVREIFASADVVIGSLTKDFCVTKGGIIATNDVKLFHRLEELVQEAGTGVDLIDRKMIALSLQNRKQIEAKVLRRMEAVRLIWHALREHNVPVVRPAGGHCVLIDVKQIPEFKDFKYPVASFLAWMYVNTGIRAAAHSVGMQKHTSINDLVRLAIPVGMKRDQSDNLIGRLLDLFDKKINIPEIVQESGVPQPLGGVHANYRLINYHKAAGKTVTGPDLTTTDPQRNIGSAISSDSHPVPASTKPPESFSPSALLPTRDAARETESSRSALDGKPRKTQDIAIVGMAGRYPKARNLSELWENLRQGRDCIEDIPADRYELRLKQGAIKKYRGGFIDDVDRFDSLFFNISPREAEMLDPQERLFLEVAWEAIEDAGYYPEILGREDGSRNIGVFVGAVWAMYQMLDSQEDQAGKKIKPNSFFWSIANRVSYWMNLSGPSLTLDTACSSSLTALYLACEAIHAGECSSAIVGGANLDLHEAKLDINSSGGGLSKDGVCRSFGKGADGYVAGEGIGALFLKPFDQAIHDRDNIYGVIKSAVVNHGGHTSGYTIPNPKAQTNLILSALEKANIDARSISYVEAHGTGTELGDPLEISGLSSAFKSHAVKNQTCAVGSIKSNIGHLEAAAGVVSVSKVLLQMKHRQLVPSLHCSQLNEFIDFENSPFFVVQRLEDWKSREVDGVQVPLRAGVSSFGAGGANAHVILESYEPLQHLEEEPAPANELIFPLSARAEDQLREMAVRLAKAVKENNYRLMDVAHTLQVGRKSFEHRLAIRAGTKEELLDRLGCFLSSKKSEGIGRGQAKNSESITRLLNRKEKEEFIQLLSQSRAPYDLAELWVDGLFPDWRGFEFNASGKRVSLPTYPFADKRHWAGKNSSARSFLQPAAAIHPMVDTNESTFERQFFKKTFHDRDFFIYDHHVASIPTLPGVAYLELARKVGEIAAGRKVQRIKNVVWISPIAVQNSTPKEVFIELKPADTTVRFEVFSYDKNGSKVPHSQGTLLYATRQEEAAEPEFIDLQAIRARCAKVIEGKDAYPKFKSFGLSLGPSFQVVHEVYKNKNEILGVLKLPEFRQGDLESMVLQPSLMDGSMQAGVSAHLGEELGEMFVPFSIGEVEILYPLQSNCFSYATEMQGDRNGNRESARFVKSDVLIVDETGKVLIKIRESVGVPLREVYKKPAPDAETDGFSKLYYSYEWEKAPLKPENPTQPNSHAIVLFDTQETLRDLYRARLTKDGKTSDQVILVQPGDSFQDAEGHSYKINPRNKEDYTKLFQSLVENKRPIEKICFAWPLGHPDLLDPKCVDEALARGVYPFLFVCQSLIQQKLENKVQLLYLYSTPENEIQPSNEAVSGFIKALRVEHPKLLSKTLEVRQDDSGYDQILNAVSAEFQAQTQDATAVRYQAEERYIKKLRILKLEEATDLSPSHGIGLKDKGVYLITGGAGGLGLIFGEFLAKEHKAKLVLAGRSKLSKEQEAKLNELTSAGAEVLYLSADVSNREEVTKLIHESKTRFGQINGIIHAAGVLRDSYVRNKTPEEMNAVFAPKIYGALHLDAASQNENLDFFVMFSSVAAVGGNAGQCDYSFANHFMDSFVGARELLRAKGARSGKTLSLNWSLWADGGMKVDEQTEIYFKKTLGIKPLSKAIGIEAFVKGLASEKSQFAVVEGIQEKVELVWGLRKKAPAPAMSAAASSSQAQSSIADGKDADLVVWLQKELSEIVMQFLKLEAEDVSTDKILLDLGFDSIGLTTFANTINEKYQLDITPVLFFDYPTIAEIAKYLSVEKKNELLRFYQGSADKTQAAVPSQRARPIATPEPAENRQEASFAISKGWNPSALDRELSSPSPGGGFSPELRFINQPIAIVGMSGVMPQSEDLDEFWENLKNSKDLITVIPPDRWIWEDYYGDPLKEANKSNSKWGGFMKEIDKFDPLFFGISPREARMMDPQQRLFLQTVWKAIEDSGQKVSDLSGSRTGLFVGAAADDYAHLINSFQIPLDGYSAAGNSHSVLANRVSFLLNLHGPSAPIDTACSSSVIALHRAIESIHTGSCDMAIVGGVQIMLNPAGHIAFSSAGMLSADGKCKTFDKRANGYVRGEGCGAIFLKTLKAAEADGNHIYAVIRATAENHGGKVTTLTAPNASAQSALLIEAYEKAHIDPTTVGYIECHGTGTSLGDPIEIQALSKAFSELYKKHRKAPARTPHCALSSVKTNIGHLETAAGIASILKVLLAIKHKQIPANINFEEINPYINLKGTPFYIADKLTAWEAATGQDGLAVPRRAGISSFGFGGANAHIVLEEYIPPRRASAPAQEPQLVVLSAKNEERLKAYVQTMQAYLEEGPVELADLAYTLQVGRDEMLERLALVISSAQDLKQKFAEILTGENPKDCYRNNIRSKNAKSQTAEASGAEALARDLIEKKELSRLAELWVRGLKIDWYLLHKSEAPRRISAPTYPFARERHWLPGADGKTSGAPRDQSPPGAAQLHPLIHRNVSTLTTQKFASRFTGREFFLADHKTKTQAVLPAVAYIELIAAAGEFSGEKKVQFIREMVWMTPLMVENDAKEVEVLLTPLKNEIDFAVNTLDRGHSITHCRGKLAYSGAVSELDVLNIGKIQERCSDEVIAGKELYAFIDTSGLNLGKAFHVVQKVYASRNECLAVLQLPEHLKDEADQFWLHPVMLDGAVHTSISMVKKNKAAIPWSIPYSVSEVQISRSLRDVSYAHAIWDLDSIKSEKSFIKISINFLDRNGTVLVRMKDFVAKPILQDPAKISLREEASQHRKTSNDKDIEAGLQSLVPLWNRARLETRGRDNPPKTAKILLLGRDGNNLEWVRRSYPNSQLLHLVPKASVEIIEKELVNCSFDQLLWVAPDVHPNAGPESGNDELIEKQEEGVVAVFRIIKALLQSGHANKKLQWTIITSRTHRVLESDRIQPAHAGIAGLIGSLAKEYPQWDLRLIDVDSLASVSAQDCLSLPWDKQGNGLAHRQGEWFQQGLASIATLPQGPQVYRQNGVYIVIGGAGGVGEVWSRFMIENYNAKLVWIGRRECNATIQEKINSMARLGHAPLYISADAANVSALEQAFRTIRKTYPTIHGVVHSAIVLHDQSIARMEEAGFRASLSAKVDTSVNIDRVFGNQELDFMLFFSSIVSFVKSPGQSNYSAGCTFKDSFAQRLQQEHAYPVKIMNWGYWGNVGVVADESHNELMRRMGIGSIEAHEGMAMLQALVNSEVRQMALIKTLNREATAGLRLSETITCYPKTVPTVLPKVQAALSKMLSVKSIAALERELPSSHMNELATEIFASSLKSLGLFSNGIHRIAGLSLEKQPAPYYERWLSGSIRYLQQQSLLADDLTFNHEVRGLADLWAEWEKERSVWAANPNLQAQIALFESCLKALPEILSGKQRATDVIFPNSSMQLVEGIYRGNVLADYFNEVLSDTLISCIEHQLQESNNSRIRIVEIGAGTGGTTTKLLPLLQRFPIEEYRYTDISKAFLMYADKHFKPQFPALTTSIFDVSKPLAVQSIPAGHYDVAIAANVLHATPDIRETLRNAKAVLKNQGVLLLNEISTWSLFNHLTFGLLEGWWLNEDTALRLPGSPGLSTDKWHEILAEEGFESIFFPALEAHKLGQQTVAACSNGWVRQSMAKKFPLQPSVGLEHDDMKTGNLAGTEGARKATQSSHSAELTEQLGNDHIKRIIVEKLSEALKIDAAKISNEAPLAEYGVDSIIGVDLVRTINETLQIELETISLFEHSTIDALAQHIWTKYQNEIATQLGPIQSTSQKPAPAEETPIESDRGLEHRFMKAELLAEVDKRANFAHEHESSSGNAGVEPIAIVGMSGRFAGSESLDEFWENLEQGKNLIGKVSRWSTTECVTSESEGNGYCCHGSFINSIDQFDPSFFRISPVEALYMDPQQRLFLEEAWKALEDAGYAGTSVNETRCGIYVGCGASGYGNLFVGEPPAHAFWGNSPSIIPARLAYHLNLQGPAISVDTACSSSLVSVHLACQALWSREMDMAIAGGVCLHPTPAFYHVANRARMLSPEGECRSFDANANGFVPGEGVGVVVLKRLRDALRDGDYIHGVIAGSGINQDGTSNGLIAPNARAQEKLERLVYDRFKVNPETIQVIEAHGTGTIVGDSIECLAITRAFREYTDKKQFCAIGTVKTNIGHTGPASGVAGILKLLLSLKHRQIPPCLHFQSGNPAIDFKSNPFYVNTQLKEWRVEDNQRRRGAVSSFGFSGTNAHLVIEEAPSVERATFELPGYIAVLSARTEEQLKQQVHNLLGFLKRTTGLSMNDLSFTLFVGRMHLPCRLSCVARNQKELIHFLEQWIETGAANQVYASEIQESRIRENISLKKFGNYCIRECKNASDAVGYLENLAAIAELYVKGYSLDFRGLFPPDSRRIPLPTYPFAREHYWVDTNGIAKAQSTATAAVHASLHTKDDATTEAVMEPAWLFSAEQLPAAKGNATQTVPMAAEEKIELFLKQETALQLHKPIKKIPTNVSYFDLGLPSLAITTLVHKVNSLLNESLSPSALFEHRDIQSLASYLAATYPSKIDALTVIRQEVGQTHSGRPRDARPPNLTPLPGTKDFSACPGPSSNEQTTVTASEAESNGVRVSEDVWWQEVPRNDGYEKVTF
ncbi:MAG TPA: SDR family NAD(P)-dependent oxidoreductase [Candidatus Angelobacter sp.]|nr:SDR family NAD(P)-dependent oxidoreductase [Candidatus Angelobacter sp.]